jgi:hypothetical protein
MYPLSNIQLADPCKLLFLVHINVQASTPFANGTIV